MALYTEADGKQWIAFHTSPDLKSWTYQSRIEGFFECPDLFELPLPGKPGEKKWILTAADSGYRIGTFDGKTFTPETPKLKGHSGAGFYAAQTFIGDPQGRVVQMGWFQTATPGMPFNQAMTLPLELSLAATPSGSRLAWSPVKELASLRTKTTSRGPGALSGGEKPVTATCGELVEIECAFEPEATATFELVVRGVKIVYDAKQQQIVVNGHRAAAPLRDGKQRIHLFVDRVGLEVFTSDGIAYVPMPITPAAGAREISVAAEGGKVKVTQFDVHDLKSIWP